MKSEQRALRIRHTQGERLTARDLQDEQLTLTWMRGLHVVALHDTWGISLGFDAQWVVDKEGRGSAFVTPGFAYDYRGREIALAQTQQVFAPLASGAYVLVMRYDETLGGDRDEFAPCSSGRERPVFVWRRANAVRLGLEIPLLGVSDKGEADLSVRRYTQPMVRPHVGSGLTPPEQVWWNWNGPAVLNVERIGFQTWVDTSKAGFVQTPHYLAYPTYSSGTLNTNSMFGAIAARSSLLLPSMRSRYATGFYFQFTIARGQTGVPSAGFDWTQFPKPQISWIGVEPIAGCAPSLSWEAIALSFRLPGMLFFQGKGFT